jgi:hypothetical protein
MKHLTLAALSTAALVVLPTLAPAEEGHHDQSHRGHGAHVHGLGRLDLAQEGAEVYLSLVTPAANLLGFEHRPRGDAERAALEETVAALRDGPALFRFTEAAGCTLAEALVESSLLGPEGLGGGEASGEDHGQDQDGGDHADMEVEYRFHCARPAELKEVRVTLFDRFPALQRLDVQLATDHGQGAAELTPTNPVLKP